VGGLERREVSDVLRARGPALHGDQVGERADEDLVAAKVRSHGTRRELAIWRDRVALLQDVESSERRRELEAAALGEAGRVGRLVADQVRVVDPDLLRAELRQQRGQPATVPGGCSLTKGI